MGSIVLVLAVVLGPQAPSLALRGGDRVVFLGDAVAEAMQERGDLELALTCRFPEADVRFRNLAFAGDTVWGDALAGFDTPEDGYRRRLELVKRIEPTVVFCAFGANESWGGEPELKRFVQGYQRLLDDLKRLGPREVVLIAPSPQENLGPPFPDPSAHNADVARYRRAVRLLAEERGLRIVDPAGPGGPAAAGEAVAAYPLTDDGLHPTEAGHWRLSRWLAGALGVSTAPVVPIELVRRAEPTDGVVAAETFSLSLPVPPPAGLAPVPGEEIPGLVVACEGLAPGRYTLRVDGVPVASATAREWAEGVRLVEHPERARAEELRRAVARKNRLFFDQVRPQNNVYLFGFRKHEQGRNAAEIPRFEPLIAEQEAEIARLRRPEARTFELVREKDEVRP